MKNIILSISLIALLAGCKNETTKEVKSTVQNEVASIDSYQPKIEIMPISHATFAMKWDDKVFYIDPVGGIEAFQNMPEEDVILITDIHGDHLNLETLNGIRSEGSLLIVPEAVNEKIKEDQSDAEVIHNDQSTSFDGFKVTAIPMYNLTEERLKFHEKGRGNGYVIEKNDYKVYISGDTEDIPEMRALQGIDKAFVCMNLPYTMTVESAADAVLDFAPVEVYPYHYRGTEGKSDVIKFKELVNTGNSDIQVNQLEWYPN
ncbi:MBL fold metallo-hydrolase [Nonlabens ulvanivorans]|uniref:Beta-lactamase n=1 Tax=Nonlabens ulvanivorans TaxID=906888 RepID=A0A084JVE3_NONUL|nr:MBL fold metallo-hydrolase [Nonlabens ulvanivorans]KEZ92927.1 beta-lactamase [Nonlabens ulvanivorans]PRX12844.1 L-ascorbate metabolism protein UlaG (beta-lactamase superfamily) [Nonlabens ulvanivorans]